MKSAQRMDLWLITALGALFIGGCSVWAFAWTHERDSLITAAQDQLVEIALQVQDDARCVELFAERTLPGGSNFYLIAPSDTSGEVSDTLSRYRVHTAGPDTILQRSRFPVEMTANMQVHVRLNFLLPLGSETGSDPEGSSTNILADGNMLCANLEGRRMELVDTALLSRSLQEVMDEPAYSGSFALIIDTVAMDTLYRSHWSASTAAIAPMIRTTELVRPGLAPWALVLVLPGAARAAFDATFPYLLLFLVLFGALVFTILRSRTAWLEQQRFATMQLDLVSNITHEFNTPLTHISLALDALRRTIPREADQHMLEVIGQENDRMQANVKKVMAVSVLDQDGLPLERELHDVHELLGATLRSLVPTLEKEGVGVGRTFEANDPWVLADATYLIDVLHSVLDNAIKYGRVPKQVVMRTINSTEGLTILIADNGPGVPEDERELVFRKFYRGTNGHATTVKGTGIGLYFARKVVQAHGGSIRMVDGPLGGAAIEIHLPQEDHG